MKNLAGWNLYKIFLSFPNGRRLVWERFSPFMEKAFSEAHEIALKEFPGEFPEITVGVA